MGSCPEKQCLWRLSRATMEEGQRPWKQGYVSAQTLTSLLTCLSQIHSLAFIVLTTLVPSFMKPNPTYQAWQEKGDICLSNLHQCLQIAFTMKLMPQLYELLGTILAWEQPEDDDIKKLWEGVFPQEQSLELVANDWLRTIVIKLVTYSLPVIQWCAIY